MAQCFDENVKNDIIQMHLNGRTIKDLSDEYRVGRSTISKWMKQYRDQCGSMRKVEEENYYINENRKLKKEIYKIRSENEFLKKVVKFFAKGFE